MDECKPLIAGCSPYFLFRGQPKNEGYLRDVEKWYGLPQKQPFTSFQHNTTADPRCFSYLPPCDVTL